MIKPFLLLLILILTHSVAVAQERTLTTIAFGSCSHEYDTNQMWDEVIKQNPDVWIWLGDIIYADTEDMTIMKQKYDRQKAHVDYQKMKSICPIIGVWDDHDYGVNDGGKEYVMKKQSKELLLDFLDVPSQAPVRTHEGVYNSYEVGEGETKVKIILLDTRYFRDPLVTPNGKAPYQPSSKGDILGEDQWQWLENELKNSDAALHIIGTSIQFIPTQHSYEKWMNLSSARARMIKLLTSVKPTNTIFISGDRHIAEISTLSVDGLPYPLYEFTSSGLTHTWNNGKEENRYRIGQLIKQKNYGLITIDWASSTPRVMMTARGENNNIYLKHAYQY